MSHPWRPRSFGGREVIVVLDPLRKCVGELNAALNVYLRARAGAASGYSETLLDTIDKIILMQGTEKNQDEFSIKVSNSVNSVEDFVRPKLREFSVR